MAVDATGTPTSLGIPKYNPDADAPSGLGFNAAMDSINTLIAARMNSPAAPVAGDVPVWDSGTSTWKPSSVKKFGISGIDASTASDGQVVRATSGNAVWGYPSLTWNASNSTVVSSTTLTALLSQLIPGGLLSSTRKLRLRMGGDYKNNSGGTSTFRLQITWGGVTLYDATSAGIAASATRRAFFLDIEIAAIFDAGHQVMSGMFSIGNASAPTTGISNLSDGTGPALLGPIASNGTVAVDSTVAEALNVSIAHGVNNANTDLRIQHGMIELIGQ